jgi:predicted alpha/beta superfamily hydrolase
MKFFSIILVIAALLFLQSVILSSSNPRVKKEVERFSSLILPNTQVRKLFSEHTKQAYSIYVSMPPSYINEPKKKYPSIFVLDADYAFALTKQISEHLSDRGRLQECIIFGIAYDGPLNYRLNRTRDYTISFVKTGGYGPEFQKHSGGAPLFANFIEQELLPYLSEHFRLNSKKILTGHSFGGLFSSFMLVTRPHVFSDYLIVSPSLWYDQGLIFKMINSFQKNNKQSLSAFFAIGENENKNFRMVDDMKRFVSLLPKEKLRLKSLVLPDENHDTVFPAALTRGLIYLLGPDEHELRSARLGDK